MADETTPKRSLFQRLGITEPDPPDAERGSAPVAPKAPPRAPTSQVAPKAPSAATTAAGVVNPEIRAALAVSDTLWLLGRERGPEGEIIPGAYIKKTYNLIERGLAWHTDVIHMREFGETYSEIDADFATL